MKIWRYFVTSGLIFLMLLTAACSKIEDEDMLQQDDLDWIEEGTSDGSEDIMLGNQSGADENTIQSVGANINILSSRNMPITSETLVYKGSEMSYGAILKNESSFTADYTFFIIINGYIQPFILEETDEAVNTATFRLEPNEEKIIHYSFTPIMAPYEDNAVITLVGFIANTTPSMTLDNILTNSMMVSVDKYLTAESSECQISMQENLNNMGNAIEKLYKPSDGQSSQVILSDQEEDGQSVFISKTEELNSDNTISIYAARINDEKLRAFLWCEGELLPVFEGEYYADIPDDEYALYEIPIDNSQIKKGESQRYSVFYIDMSQYDNINDEEKIHFFTAIHKSLELYVIS